MCELSKDLLHTETVRQGRQHTLAQANTGLGSETQGKTRESDAYVTECKLLFIWSHFGLN